MRHEHRAILLVATILILASWAAAAEANTSSTANPFHWKGTVAAGQTVELRGIEGDMNIEGAAGNEVEVTANKSGEGADEVRIDVVPHAGGVTICAVYPGDSRNGCETGENSHSRNGHNRARVDFTLRMPRDAKLDAKNVNGSIEAKNLGSEARTISVNGRVRVETSSWAEAKSVNGAVNVRMGKADWPDELRIESVNGRIHLEVPADLNADVTFQTLNGNVQSDFPFTVGAGNHIVGRPGTHISGKIGNGGRQLELKTVNGSIELRKLGI
jgi:DUF4097 and DUF4098 domain-containing protein YvlB